VTLDLATGRYSTFIDAMGIPVQTSIGRPKFPLAYDLTEQAKRLMPWGLISADLTEADFTDHYRARLDKVGVDAMRRLLYAISARHGGARLVLLCFERPDQFCHRHVWRYWWEERTGQIVSEIEPAPAQPQLTDAADAAEGQER
jgi:hypothetical protein